MPAANGKAEIGRLAFRVEGEMWNAYWAPSQQSMDGAVPLGSIRLSTVTGSRRAKNGFMALMRDLFSSAVKDALGQTPTWGDPVTAPERERAGRA